MKKLFALVLCLMLSFSCAMAEELPVIEFDEANLEGIGGEWMLLENFGLQLFVPDIFGFLEVPQEQADQGIIAVMATEDLSASISLAYSPVMDHLGNQIPGHAELVEYYASNGYENIATCLINGLEATNFVIENRDMMCMVYFLADGNALSFYYTPISNENMLALHSIIASTVMLAEAE